MKPDSSKQVFLLISICIVSCSGAVKLYFAHAMLGIPCRTVLLPVAALITYAAYAFDRGVANQEDEYRDNRTKQVLFWSAIICTILSFVLYPNPALLIPFLIAYIYTKGIGGYRLKGGRGVKNIVVASTFALGMVIFLGVFSIPGLLVYCFFFIKSFVNTIIYDVRDIIRDKNAGILTIPVLMSPGHLRVFLLSITLVVHGILYYACRAALLFNGDIIAVSAIHTGLYIVLYSGGVNLLRNVVVDGEWLIYTGYLILRDWAL